MRSPLSWIADRLKPCTEVVNSSEFSSDAIVDRLSKPYTKVVISPASNIDLVKKWAPEKSPLHWAVINAICFLSCMAVLFDIFMAEDHLIKRPFVRASYIVWNFGTTVVWLFETSFTVIHQIPRPLTWEHVIEIFLAVYFLVDSLEMLYEWQVKHGKLEEELHDVCINGGAYLYELVECVRIYSARSSFTEIESNDTEEMVIDDEEQVEG